MSYCIACRTEYDTGAKRCLRCGLGLLRRPAAGPGSGPAAPRSRANRAVSVLFATGAAVYFVWLFLGSGPELRRSNLMEEVDLNVPSLAVQRYELAERRGDRMDACVQAGRVASSYLQVEDELGYRRWKRAERRDCAAAGIAR